MDLVAFVVEVLFEMLHVGSQLFVFGVENDFHDRRTEVRLRVVLWMSNVP